VAVVLAETLIRSIVPTKTDDPKLLTLESDSPDGRWASHRLAASQTAVHGGQKVSINQWGCRDDEFAETPDPKQYPNGRILVTGDSFVYGDGVAQDETVSAQLQKSCSKDLEVINCGQWGHNTVDTFMLYQKELIRFKASTVLHVYVLNDAECTSFCDSKPPVSNETPNRLRESLTQRSLFLKFLFSRWDSLKPSRNSFNYYDWAFTHENKGWEISKRYLKKLAEITQENRQKLIVAIFPLMADFRAYPMTKAHQTILAACHELKIECVDLLPAFQSQPISASRLHAQLMDSHPNKTAYRIAAEYLKSRIAGCESH